MQCDEQGGTQRRENQILREVAAIILQDCLGFIYHICFLYVYDILFCVWECH